MRFLPGTSHNIKKVSEEPVLTKIVDCIRMVGNNEGNACYSVIKIEADLTDVSTVYMGSLNWRIKQDPLHFLG